MAEVRLTIIGDDKASPAFKAVKSASDDLAGGVNNFESATKKASSTAMEFVKGLALWETIKQIGHWLKDIASGFLESGNATEQYQARLETLLGSQKEGSRLFKEMSDYAARVPFEFNHVMEAATSLAGVMKGGVSEIKRWMPMIGDLAAASGLSVQVTTEQVIRMYSAGAASADLFRERGILAMMGFQSGVQYSASETRKKMMEEWTKADSQFHGATDKLAGTWEGALSMMKDKWFLFKDAVMKAGVMDWLKAVLGELQGDIDRAFDTGSAQAWAQTVANTVVSVLEKVATAVAYVYDAFRGWVMIWDVLKISFSTVAEFILAGVQKIGSGLKVVMEATNIGGIFDGPIEKLGTFESKISHLRTTLLEMKSEAKIDLFQLANEDSAVKKVEDFFGRVHKKIDEMKTKVAAAANEIERPKVLRVDMTQALDALAKIGIGASQARQSIASIGVGMQETTGAVTTSVTQLYDWFGMANGRIINISVGAANMAAAVIEDFGAIKHYMPDTFEPATRSMVQLETEAAELEKRLKEIKLGDITTDGAIIELNALRDRADKVKQELSFHAEPHLNVNAFDKELQAIKAATEETGKVIETQREIKLSTDKARNGAIELRTAIDTALPDPIEKNVIVKYFTQASPIMGFTEGMAHIKDMMNSLPKEGEFKIKFPDLQAQYDKAIQMQQLLDSVGGDDQGGYNTSVSYDKLVHSLGQQTLDEAAKYQNQLNMLNEHYAMAMELSGKERIDALMAWQRDRASAARQVVDENGAVIVSMEQAANAALKDIWNANRQITEDRKNIQQEANAAWDEFKNGAIDAATAVTDVNSEMAKVRATLFDIAGVIQSGFTMKFYTQASPVMPFSEGMTHINDMMKSLPTEGEYTMKFKDLTAQWQDAADTAARYDSLSRAGFMNTEIVTGGRNADTASNKLWQQIEALVRKMEQDSGKQQGMSVQINPTVQVNSGGQSGSQLGSEIQTKIADDIRTDRSPIMPAVKDKLRAGGYI